MDRDYAALGGTALPKTSRAFAGNERESALLPVGKETNPCLSEEAPEHRQVVIEALRPRPERRRINDVRRVGGIIVRPGAGEGMNRYLDPAVGPGLHTADRSMP